jgi:HK97 gp10 family phage protein
MRVTLEDARLRKLVENVKPSAAGRVVKSVAFQVEGKAKMLAPVDTGALRNSIYTERQDDITYWVIAPVAYAAYVELGTSRMRAQPYLVPALEGMRAEFNRRMAELVSKL